jgi:LAO/AO transport system kinase
VYLHHSGELSRRRLAERVRAVVERRLRRLGPGEEIVSESLRALEWGELSPYAVAERIVKEPGVHPR